jgi:hypothetical protein
MGGLSNRYASGAWYRIQATAETGVITGIGETMWSAVYVSVGHVAAMAACGLVSTVAWSAEGRRGNRIA